MIQPRHEPFLALAFGHLFLGLAYLFGLGRSSLTASMYVSVTTYIDASAPVVALAFLSTSGGLAAATLRWSAWVPQAMALAFTVEVGYAVALTLSWVLSDPRPALVSTALAWTVAACGFVMFRHLRRTYVPPPSTSGGGHRRA